jgi:type I restriction enzyme S subunit
VALVFEWDNVNIYNAYITRREINGKLKSQFKDICPILIRGAVGESNEY